MTENNTIHKKRKHGMLGIFVVLVIATSFVVAGSVLQYYGRFHVTANAQQSVLVNGEDYTHAPFEHQMSGSIFQGYTECFKDTIENIAPTERLIYFDNVDAQGSDPSTDVLITRLMIPCDDYTLHLENKDPNTWIPIQDQIYADLTIHCLCNTVFSYTLSYTGLLGDTEYAIIYYADQPDRFTNWGGNPVLVLDTFTTSSGTGGYIHSQDLDVCIPYPDDWNTGLYPDSSSQYADYTASDGYTHKWGAKIWIVPTSHLNSGWSIGCQTSLSIWTPSEILFETDLVMYCDCNVEPHSELVSVYRLFANSITTSMCGVDDVYLLDGNSKYCLITCYIFPNIGNYDFMTYVRPLSCP